MNLSTQSKNKKNDYELSELLNTVSKRSTCFGPTAKKDLELCLEVGFVPGRVCVYHAFKPFEALMSIDWNSLAGQNHLSVNTHCMNLGLTIDRKYLRKVHIGAN